MQCCAALSHFIALPKTRIGEKMRRREEVKRKNGRHEKQGREKKKNDDKEGKKKKTRRREEKEPPNEFSSTHCRLHLAPFYMTAMNIVLGPSSTTALKEWSTVIS